MKITIKEEILKALPEIKIGFLVIEGIDIDQHKEEMAKKLQNSIKNTYKKYKGTDVNEIKLIKKWKNSLEKVGIDPEKHPVSVKALLKRIQDQKEIRSINPLVDLYNSITIDTLIPMGAYNLDTVKGDITLGYANGTEIYHPLGKKELEKAEKGEFLFMDEKEAMCRYWVCKQGKTHAISPYTKNIIFRVEAICQTDKEFKDAMASLAKEIKKYFKPGKIESYLLTKTSPECEFDKPKKDENQSEIENLLNRGTVEVIVREDLEAKLRSGKKLRIKLGIDPTGSDLHIGHGVVLRKLKHFQDAGHTAILLIGDYTARIGDPTGKSETRVMLTEEQIHENMKHYIDQASKILDIDKLEIRHNSEWFEGLTMAQILELAAQKTVNQMLHREDFKNRFKNDQDISSVELLYPLMQGYDSVMLESDVEIGGTDQTFNMLVGRDLQKKLDCKVVQNVLTVPILEGLDGVEKMSKSLNNYIGLTESANEMFGKTMSIPDNLIPRYFELATDVSMDEIQEIKESLSKGENPKNLKIRLAKEIVTLYHDKKEADQAEKEFAEVFANKGIPEEIKVKKLAGNKWNIVDLIAETGLTASKSETRRIIQGGGVKIDGEKINSHEDEIDISSERLIQVGKRKFMKIIKK